MSTELGGYGAAELREMQEGRQEQEAATKSRTAALGAAVFTLLFVATLAITSPDSFKAAAPTQAAVKKFEATLAQHHRTRINQRLAESNTAQGSKVKALQQSLDASMTQYDDASGLLVTRHYSNGLSVQLYWHVDSRYDTDQLPSLFAPEAVGLLPKLDIESYSDIQDLVAKNLKVPTEADASAKEAALAKINFPAEADTPPLVLFFAGNVPIDKPGIYEICLDSNAGGFLNISDSTSEASIEIVNDAAAKTCKSLNLTEGIYDLRAKWSAVKGETPRMIATIKGPSTEEEEQVLEGRHWTDLGPGDKPKGSLDQEVEHGWGCRFYYFATALTALPTVEELLAELPDSAAKVDHVNISSHADLWFLGGEEDEQDYFTDKMAVMCMGLVKVEAGGNYKLSLVTDDGGGLAVDGIDVLEEDGEVDPFVTTCDSMKLLPGFHEVTIRWFNNGVQGNAARPAGAPADEDTPYEKQTGGQVLVAMYQGPDTGDTSEHTLDTASACAGPVMEPADASGMLTWTPGAAPGGEMKAMLLQGYYKAKGFGDIKGLELKGGKKVEGHLLGYSASKGKFRKERSPLEKFDEAWLKDNKDKDWKDHGKMFESDIAIPSGNIIKPWTDYSKAAYEYGHHKRLPVPDSVYTKNPAYDTNVVDIGGKGIAWDHAEGHIGDDIDTVNGEENVMGKSYEFPEAGWVHTIASAGEGSG